MAKEIWLTYRKFGLHYPTGVYRGIHFDDSFSGEKFCFKNTASYRYV